MNRIVEVRCVDCGHVTAVHPGRAEQELIEMCWEKKGKGWQCPYCYYAEKRLRFRKVDL